MPPAAACRGGGNYMRKAVVSARSFLAHSAREDIAFVKALIVY